MPHKSIKQGLLIFLIVLMLAMIGAVLIPFINGLLGALSLHILFRNFHSRLSLKKGMNASRAAILIILFTFIVILLPIVYITLNLLESVGILLNNYEKIWEVIHNYLDQFQLMTGFDVLNIDNIKSLTQKVATYIPGVFNSTAGIFSEIIMMYFTLYYTLTEKEKIEEWVKSHMPFNRVNNIYLLETLEKSTLSNLSGIPIIALVQGICAWILYLLCGLDQAFSWALMTAIASIIPIVGTALIWVPIAFFLYINHQMWQSLFLAGAGIVIITNIDNGLRMTVLKKITNTHPMISIFGIIIGLNLIGFMGIIYGPILLNYFFILFDIYKKEYT